MLKMNIQPVNTLVILTIGGPLAGSVAKPEPPLAGVVADW